MCFEHVSNQVKGILSIPTTVYILQLFLKAFPTCFLQLSYYRSQAEMSHTCRGTISLHGAHIQTEDSCNFIVSNGGGTQVGT
jgi:hypothetical protein